LSTNAFGSPLKSFITEDDNDDKETSSSIVSWLQLHSLLNNSIKNYNNSISVSGNNQIDVELPIILVGFSKGCVVLNQLCNDLIDFNSNQIETTNISIFQKNLNHIFWLDAGHSSMSNVFITNEIIINKIKEFNIKCYIFVTPYQMNNGKQLTIDEYKQFTFLIKDKFKIVNKIEYLFKEKEEEFKNNVKIDTHFKVLLEFDTNLL
jgi:hypothetical protein